MKKTFTCSFLLAVCLSFFASCSKDVKAPIKVPATAAATTKTIYTAPTTYTAPQTTSQTQGGHTCGGGGSYTDNGSGTH